MFKIFILSLSLLVYVACSSTSKRDVASAEQTSLTISNQAIEGNTIIEDLVYTECLDTKKASSNRKAQRICVTHVPGILDIKDDVTGFSGKFNYVLTYNSDDSKSARLGRSKDVENAATYIQDIVTGCYGNEITLIFSNGKVDDIQVGVKGTSQCALVKTALAGSKAIDKGVNTVVNGKKAVTDTFKTAYKNSVQLGSDVKKKVSDSIDSAKEQTAGLLRGIADWLVK